MIATRLPAGARAIAVPALFLAALACNSSSERASAADTVAAAPTPAAAVPAPTPAVATGETVVQGAMLDPNTATREQLAAAPGVPGHVADAIVAGRPYKDMRDVNKVLLTHVPDSVARKAVYASVWKPIDLNTASDEEILLIPGIGRRMLHEFKEYRPYKAIEQFRREIGKYVDKTEVARLEKYVSVK